MLESEQWRIAAGGFADKYYERLVGLISDFEKGLDSDHEVGARLVSFGQVVSIHVTSIGYYNPYLIVFDGKFDDGTAVTLVQHVSQISFLLFAVRALERGKPRRVGFNTEKADD